MRTIKADLDIGDAFDGFWETLDRSTGPLPQTLIYDKGLVSDDPLSQTFADPATRDVWIDVLTDVGYQAADIKFDNGETGWCDQHGWLTVMSQSVKQTLDGPKGVPSGADTLVWFADACAAANVNAAMQITVVADWTQWSCTTSGWEGSPDPADPAKCVYSKCKFCTRTRIVKAPDSNGVMRCWRETSNTERCCTSPQRCDKLPNGSCPNGNSGACGDLQSSQTCALSGPPATTNDWPTEWARPTSPVRETQPVTCP